MANSLSAEDAVVYLRTLWFAATLSLAATTPTVPTAAHVLMLLSPQALHNIPGVSREERKREEEDGTTEERLQDMMNKNPTYGRR